MGPNFYDSLFVGCKNEDTGRLLKQVMQTPYFRIVVVDDEDTVELCGALKVCDLSVFFLSQNGHGERLML